MAETEIPVSAFTEVAGNVPKNRELKEDDWVGAKDKIWVAGNVPKNRELKVSRAIFSPPFRLGVAGNVPKNRELKVDIIQEIESGQYVAGNVPKNRELKGKAEEMKKQIME